MKKVTRLVDALFGRCVLTTGPSLDVAVESSHQLRGGRAPANAGDSVVIQGLGEGRTIETASRFAIQRFGVQRWTQSSTTS